MLWVVVCGFIGVYYWKYKSEKEWLSTFSKERAGDMENALKGERFEITDEQAEERLILMEKKKEEQRGEKVNTKKLRDRFDKTQLGLAKLFSPSYDLNEILEEQAKYEKELKSKVEKGEISSYKFNSR